MLYAKNALAYGLDLWNSFALTFVAENKNCSIFLVLCCAETMRITNPASSWHKMLKLKSNLVTVEHFYLWFVVFQP